LVADLDKTTAFIRFADAQPVGTPPPITPHTGQSSYDANAAI